MDLKLRPADPDDERLLWEWVNDPLVRSSALQSGSIEWESHRLWFRRRLDDPDCLILIAEIPDCIPVGQVRFEWNSDGEAVVGISVDEKFRGLGFGSKILAMGVQTLFNLTNALNANAYIKTDNIGSINTFTRAGFTRMETTELEGIRAEHYILSRSDEDHL